MSAFKVGDLCVAVGMKSSIHLNGCQCTILTDAEYGSWPNAVTKKYDGFEHCHRVRWEDGSTSRVPPYRLKKIDPPNKDEPITYFVPCEPEFFQDLMKRVKHREGV